MSDYEEVKSMVNAAALLANAAKAEMRRVEAEEEMGFVKIRRKIIKINRTIECQRGQLWILHNLMFHK